MKSDVALYYHPDAYVERYSAASGGPQGVMGRQVAGEQFLDAYLTHGRWETLVAVSPNPNLAKPLLELCQRHPSSRDRARRLQYVPEADFANLYSSDPPSAVLHFPHPPSERFAWLRLGPTPPRVAICGVTHTLASPAAIAAICALVTAPFEPYDAVVCTSQAVVRMVRTVMDDWADYLSHRFGGRRPAGPRLEVIPLGVNVERFSPATDQQRQAARQLLRIEPDEVAVLCVGRLSHHAKAHPFPLFRAVSAAAERTGKRVHLMFAGWAAHPAIDSGFRDGAERFASNVRTTFLDGQAPAIRSAVWHAADIFASLPDNIQETFGLVLVEAMASGLPVIASDWNGYRDIVVPGETGLLVPTFAVRGATLGATQRLLFGQIDYDHFLAECTQTVTVDLGGAADAMTQLVADESLRKRLGQAGRERALARYTWKTVIAQYEALWAEQRRALVEPTKPVGSRCPEVDRAFEGYPTEWLDDSTRIQATGADRQILAHALASHSAERRVNDPLLLEAILGTKSARTVAELIQQLTARGASVTAARATIAWLLKYGLLKRTS